MIDFVIDVIEWCWSYVLVGIYGKWCGNWVFDG